MTPKELMPVVVQRLLNDQNEREVRKLQLEEANRLKELQDLQEQQANMIGAEERSQH